MTTGGIKLKKVLPKVTIQTEINKYLIENVPISAFIEEAIDMRVANTVGIKCKKCGSENIYSESRQTRSSDEAMTVFFTCLDFGARWKN